MPQDAISSHLVQLSHFYEANSPVLSNLCALLAPLSPDSLPGTGMHMSAESYAGQTCRTNMQKDVQTS